ncbi:protein-glutamine gamma-glutamyltransferase E-like [Elgaria multicarinata webbii]|uniref:protein-glutamine gamma-glutamyltransferase E-like n=1 Tax=Elgaria multicarinata webbii TaxID=159646 RepID=UPI002FCD2180
MSAFHEYRATETSDRPAGGSSSSRGSRAGGRPQRPLSSSSGSSHPGGGGSGGCEGVGGPARIVVVPTLWRWRRCRTLAPILPHLAPAQLSPATRSVLPRIDWKLHENTSSHHTDQYPSSVLVVRRGQQFAINVDVPQPQLRSLTFTVETGSTSALRERTRVEFGISTQRSSCSWGAVQTSVTSCSLGVSISSPPNAAIGRYQLGMKSTSSASPSNLGAFVLIFNPWLPEDDVFLPNDAEREEYVLSEFGVIFVGDVNRISPFPWNYGQFRDDILNICLSMLDRSVNYRKAPIKDLQLRNDPGYIGRVLSAMVNDADDDGVVAGNWDGDYRGGKNPTSWTGSVAILRKWKQSGFNPVLFGQCWVFAGVLTTVLRCLGIPTRIITNFVSAHDSDGNLILDKYIDISGKQPGMVEDHFWNYHVWNESWFTRPDLGSTYDGWQILDGTPQKESEGICQCGPASLKAIKEGEVDLSHDTPYIFAEVNADVVYWVHNETTGEKKKKIAHENYIGRALSMKAVGSDNRLDVTDNYKYPEGSAKEREVFKKAQAKLKQKKTEPVKANVTGKFKVASPPEVGKDVNLFLVLRSFASQYQRLNVQMTISSIVYNRRASHVIWKKSFPVTLGHDEEQAFPVQISYSDYKRLLTPDNMIQATALCCSPDGSLALVQRVIVLDNPVVFMKVLGEVKVGQEVQIEVSFTNPLEEELNNCVLRVEGSDLVMDKLKIKVPPLKAKETFRINLDITPSRVGTKHLLIHFSCDKFYNIKAFGTIEVHNCF